MGTFARLVIKDLRVEWNNRRRAQSLVLFGAVLAVVIGASYRSNPDLQPALPTLIWVMTVFLQLLFLGQVYQAEMENACFEGLRLSPARGSHIALAKTAASCLLVGLADLLALVILSLLIRSLEPLSPGLLLLLAIETFGFIALGNLVFATTTTGEPPAVDLYAIVLLLAAPLILFGPDATHQLLTGQDPNRASLYIFFLALYAAILAAGTAATYREFARSS